MDRLRPSLGRRRPHLDRCLMATSVRFTPSPSEFDHTWTELNNTVPTSRKLGMRLSKYWHISSKCWPMSSRCWPHSTKLGPYSAKLGPYSTNIVPEPTTLRHLRPHWGRHRPTFGRVRLRSCKHRVVSRVHRASLELQAACLQLQRRCMEGTARASLCPRRPRPWLWCGQLFSKAEAVPELHAWHISGGSVLRGAARESHGAELEQYNLPSAQQM